MAALVGFINAKKHLILSKAKSPLKVLDQSYDRIPIHYDDRRIFVEANTRQHYPSANEVKCVGVYKGAHFIMNF